MSTEGQNGLRGPMPSKVDVIVVGAGLFGASVAYNLTKGGAGKVLLLDQAMPASGDSGRTVGMVRHHYSNDVTAKLAMRGAEIIRTWPETVGVADAGFVRSGFLLAVPEQMVDACTGNVRRLQRLGLNTRFVTPDEMSEIEPLLNLEGVAGGAYEPDGGFANSFLMILGWITAAASLGLEARFGASVESMIVRKGRVVGVRTSCGVIEADKVVIASGAWARPMLAEVGWDPPIRLRRIEVSVWRVPAGTLIPQVVCSDGVSGLVVRPDRANEFLAVAYSPERPSEYLGDFDYSLSNKHDQVLSERLGRRFPALAQARPVRGWAGPYDFTPDWHPIVGPVPGVEGAYMSVGNSGHGFKLAPSIGECLAAEILGNESPIDISKLSADRLISGDSEFALAYGPGARA